MDFNSELFVSGVDKGKRVQIEVYHLFSSCNDHLLWIFQAKLSFYYLLLIGFESFDDTAVLVGKKKALSIKDRGG